MGKTIKTWILGVFSAVAATVISSLIISHLNNVDFAQGALIVFSGISSVFLYKIPIFIIIIAIVIFLVFRWLVKRFRHVIEQPAEPEWINYVLRRYKSWMFVWRYEKDYEGKYRVKQITPICECGCQLSHNIFYTQEKCPKCGTSYPQLTNEITDELQRVIEHDIRSGEYKPILEQYNLEECD